MSSKSYTYCVRTRDVCVLDDLKDTTYKTVDATTTKAKSDSTIDIEVLQQQPKTPLLPFVPDVLRNVYRAAQLFNSKVIEDNMMVVKLQRFRFLRGTFNQLPSFEMAGAKTVEILDAYKHCVGTCGWQLQKRRHRPQRQ